MNERMAWGKSGLQRYPRPSEFRAEGQESVNLCWAVFWNKTPTL